MEIEGVLFPIGAQQVQRDGLGKLGGILLVVPGVVFFFGGSVPSFFKFGDVILLVVLKNNFILPAADGMVPCRRLLAG